MKIQAINSSTKKPLSNTKFQLQVKGKDSGYLSTSTDANGYFQLDNKYEGQQIAYYTQGSTSNQWVAATDGVTLYVDIRETTTTGNKSKQTTQSYK